MFKLFLTLCLLPLSAVAEVGVADVFAAKQITEEPKYLGLALNKIRVDEAMITPGCMAIEDISSTYVAPLTKIETLAGGKAVHAGGWMAGYEVDVCGETQKRNLIFLHYPSSAPEQNIKILTALPGETMASPDLQKMAAGDFKKSFYRLSGVCDSKEFVITDTEVISAPRTGRWQEVWHARVCGQEVKNTVDFVTTYKGGILPRIPVWDGLKKLQQEGTDDES